MAEEALLDNERNDIMKIIKQLYNEREQAKTKCSGDEPLKLNILFIGRTRVGKTTLIRMLQDPTIVSSELNLKSQTKETTSYSLAIESGPVHLDLTIVDTPGFFDRQDDYSKNNLWHINEKCKQLKIDAFHIICFFVSFDNGINSQDVATFSYITDHFDPSVKANLCMIVTRCESKILAQRHKILSDIENNVSFANIKPILGLGIYFCGSLNYDDWYQANNSLVTQFKTIYEYREKLLSLFSQSNIKALRLPSRSSVIHSSTTSCPSEFSPLVDSNSQSDRCRNGNQSHIPVIEQPKSLAKTSEFSNTDRNVSTSDHNDWCCICCSRCLECISYVCCCGCLLGD